MPTFYELGFAAGYNGYPYAPPVDISNTGFEAETEWFDGYDDGVGQFNIDNDDYDYWDDEFDGPLG